MPTLNDWAEAAPGRVAVSPRIVVDQARVDQFARSSEHTHWLHTQPDAARKAGFDGTLAHGFLILSLINHAIDLCDLRPTDSAYALNYGIDKARFLNPMPVGDGFQVRDTIDLVETQWRDAGLFMKTAHRFEIDGQDRPCVVADYLCIWAKA